MKELQDKLNDHEKRISVLENDKTNIYHLVSEMKDTFKETCEGISKSYERMEQRTFYMAWGIAITLLSVMFIAVQIMRG